MASVIRTITILANNNKSYLASDLHCIDILLIYTLWFEFWNDSDAQRDFIIVTRKLVHWNHSYLKEQLNILKNRKQQTEPKFFFVYLKLP